MDKKFPPHFKSLSELIKPEEIIPYDLDIDKGIYIDWAKAYPLAIYDIFKDCLQYSKPLTQKDLDFFCNNGINLNLLYSYHSSFSCLTTPLFILAENKRVDEMYLFLRAKANPRITNENNYNILEILFMSNKIPEQNVIENVVNCEKCVSTLEKFCSLKEFNIKRWIYNEYCDEYKRYSPYLKDVLNIKGMIVDD